MSNWNVPVYLGREHGLTLMLNSEVITHIAAHEHALSAWFEKDYKMSTYKCSIGGKIVTRSDWLYFQERRDYYTSPLYQELL